jgi:arylsulfatase A-like enzyme
LATGDFELPARAELRRRGFDFRNHYAAAAMCTPSRAAFISGTPPQVNGVFDQMETGYVPSLRTDRPNMGSLLKGLGYTTAYFGKFELNKGLLKVNPSVDYHAALQPYGFDFFNFDGDKFGSPNQGYQVDRYYSGEAVRWLRTNARALNGKGEPFFMVVSFLNPHDIMYADANIPGQPPVQKALTNNLITPPPDNAIYQKRDGTSRRFPASRSHSRRRGCRRPWPNITRGGQARLVLFRPTARTCGVIFTTITSTSSKTTIAASSCSLTRWTTSICGRIRSSW